jgi:hypothetical protein
MVHGEVPRLSLAAAQAPTTARYWQLAPLRSGEVRTSIARLLCAVSGAAHLVWDIMVLKRLVLNDLYRPHSYDELAA